RQATQAFLLNIFLLNISGCKPQKPEQSAAFSPEKCTFLINATPMRKVPHYNRGKTGGGERTPRTPRRDKRRNKVPPITNLVHELFSSLRNGSPDDVCCGIVQNIEKLGFEFPNKPGPTAVWVRRRPTSG